MLEILPITSPVQMNVSTVECLSYVFKFSFELLEALTRCDFVAEAYEPVLIRVWTPPIISRSRYVPWHLEPNSRETRGRSWARTEHCSDKRQRKDEW